MKNKNKKKLPKPVEASGISAPVPEKKVTSPLPEKKMSRGLRILLILLVIAAFVGFCCLLAFSLENSGSEAYSALKGQG